MNYKKPEVVFCESAISAIQSGSQQKQLDVADAIQATDPAYEADE
jgi:hypothetical protein